MAYNNVITLESRKQGSFGASPRGWPEAIGGVNEDFPGSIGSSAAFLEVLNHVRIVAPADSTVLLEGETGTGKEVIARALHMHSRRRHNAFVAVNCAAIPAELLESEMFGHERGAFTGAVTRRLGRFEAADRGTLFLDEIGDMPFELQAKLLRVLEEQEFERLGSAQTRQVDVRVVAATNQNLTKLVADKRFRIDLYYRLNVFPILIPPLRQRPQDIPLLAAYFVKKFTQRMNKPVPKIPPEAMEALVRYPWPGNVRELQNIVERAVILTDGSVLQLSELPTAHPEPVTLQDAERAHIRKALDETNGVGKMRVQKGSHLQ
jgi:formate hydrogenlyase transcriptional activator